MKRLISISFILFGSALSSQTLAVKKSRQWYSEQTKAILDSLSCKDTLLCNGLGTIESRTIGEGSRLSESYRYYSELVKVATEKELLAILDNPKELTSIRAYALMAYIYQCEKEKKPEKHFNYTFRTNITIGCVTHLNCSFKDLNHRIRVRRFYDPVPRAFVSSEERRAIQEENKIRKEQGLPLRKTE
ncbi:MAG: hypothetical protein ACXVPQ_00190 [Bacteroidia bacterium]